MQIKYAAVADAAAEGTTVVVKLQKGDVELDSQSAQTTYLGNNTYKALIKLNQSVAAASDYSIIIKGEKHLAKKFDGISIPRTTASPYIIDLTRISLPPGDLPLQDGKVDQNDLAKITGLFTKLSQDLTDADKKTADLNYDGSIDVADAFLVITNLGGYDEK